MQEKYVPADVEAAAQSHWQAIDAYKINECSEKPKFYCVSMLPYPSGKLHMGHVRNYTINDVMYRHLRMRGYNVLMPMGWDAFGMPAENAAMANGVPPAQWTYENIAYMKKQMNAMGFAIDWSRELATCKPEYYKWNQWFFLKMLEKGLVYLKTGIVNWDPVDQTVLSNEQVIDGRGWRSGVLVEKREIPMYYMRITDYADDLLQDLNKLDWPERVKVMQQNWIGKSFGVTFGFPYTLDGEQKLLYVFTTRADTIMGVTFCVISTEHPLAKRLSEDKPELKTFINECKQGGVTEASIATQEKKGIATGFFVTHPLSGESIEIWIGNYVVMSYGEGAVMGVPAHDERDFAFAHKYNLPIKQVITVPGKEFSIEVWQAWYGDKEATLCINSGKYNGLNYHAAIDTIAADLNSKGLGKKQVMFRLRDWGISRQRYWGTPIPIIHCDACGAVPVPEKDLPVVLPENLVPDGTGNPLATSIEFLNCTCPKCHKPGRRETDTMDTFVDSSWYFSRYTCPDADTMVDARTNYWMPMDQYIGGIEHAILHLLYSRFWTKVMRDMKLVSFGEPAKNLLTQGMVLNETYYREDMSGKKTWFNPSEVNVHFDDKARPISASLSLDGQEIVLGEIEKMAKSKNNGVDPQSLINQYGADTARLFVMFAAPPEQQLKWSESGVDGASRFLRRLWNFGQSNATLLSATDVYIDTTNPTDQSLRRKIHTLLKQANYDYQRAQYNTVVSAAMKMLNAIENDHRTSGAGVMRECYGILLRILYPMVPHITHGLWTALGYDRQSGELLDTTWPEVDTSALIQAEIELILQVNGKVRGSLKIARDASRQSIEQAALGHEMTIKFSKGMTQKKVIIVPGRLVNLVIS
ncbi:leucine--tRNA ligase [Candidatus Pandoraea novymonadis]|uniref:Leucine--tRNA ligase n=1 Tax=Candidatus Pandoraea novymonadis TaxID=1808959 RepID=A0ABX5FD48_9BURK|nr:leucine--tRNA ligase [Candidatus Pandoraea novymonadis]PSB91704.1 Leucine-tRNA ligase [Candidatus Pandoraea novymonadis]